MDYFSFNGKYTLTVGKLTQLQSERNIGKIKIDLVLDS